MIRNPFSRTAPLHHLRRRMVALVALAGTLTLVGPLAQTAEAARVRGDSVTRACQTIANRIEFLETARLYGYRWVYVGDRVSQGDSELGELHAAWDDLCARTFGNNPLSPVW
jgi:hypothetical protein